MSDETELEDEFRAGLQRRADDVDTTPDLLGPVHEGARGRRRRAWVAGSVGLAAAALVTAAVVQNVGTDTGSDGGTPPVADDPQTDAPTEPLPTEWRTEAWHGLQVEVPADWAWGAGPIESEGLIRCGGPDGAEPYVGRPVASSDMCQGVDAESTPQADYVWFDAPPVSNGDLGGGYFRVTVDIDGTTVTIATDNQPLGLRIQDSVRPVEGCAASLPSAPTVDTMLVEGLRDPTSAQVCAYSPEDGDGYDLVYATTLDAQAATAYHAEVYAGQRDYEESFCANDLERVLITITGDDPFGSTEVSQATVVDPGCRQVQGSPGAVVELSDRGMDAWAQGGLPVTLYGLIGPMG